MDKTLMTDAEQAAAMDALAHGALCVLVPLGPTDGVRLVHSGANMILVPNHRRVTGMQYAALRTAGALEPSGILSELLDRFIASGRATADEFLGVEVADAIRLVASASA